jgi:hypothetical protein
MTPAGWTGPEARAVAMHVDGALDRDPRRSRPPLPEGDLLPLVNAGWTPVPTRVAVSGRPCRSEEAR